MKTRLFALGLLMTATGNAALAAPPAEPKVTFKDNGAYAVTETFLNEMSCVHDRMTQRMWDDYGAVLVLNGDNPTSKIAAKAALDECVTEYLWGPAERTLGEQMGQNEAIWDFQNLDLYSSKVTPENLETAWASLSVADRRQFLSSGWNNDQAFRERVDTALRANGVRNTSEALLTASIALGAYTFIAATRDQWVARYRIPAGQ